MWFWLIVILAFVADYFIDWRSDKGNHDYDPKKWDVNL